MPAVTVQLVVGEHRQCQDPSLPGATGERGGPLLSPTNQPAWGLSRVIRAGPAQRTAAVPGSWPFRSRGEIVVSWQGLLDGGTADGEGIDQPCLDDSLFTGTLGA